MGIESLQELKRLGRGGRRSPLPSAEVKERVQLYYYSPLRAFMAGYQVNFNLQFLYLCRP
jgi:hypothetical protein